MTPENNYWKVRTHAGLFFYEDDPREVDICYWIEGNVHRLTPLSLDYRKTATRGAELAREHGLYLADEAPETVRAMLDGVGAEGHA